MLPQVCSMPSHSSNLHWAEAAEGSLTTHWDSPGCWVKGRREVGTPDYCCCHTVTYNLVILLQVCFISPGFTEKLLAKQKQTSALCHQRKQGTVTSAVVGLAAFVSLPCSVWILHFGANPPFRQLFWMLTVVAPGAALLHCHPFYAHPHPCFLSHPYSESGKRATIPLPLTV